MGGGKPSLDDHLEAIRKDPRHCLGMSTEDLFALDWPRMEAIQLEILQRRFDELRPKVKVLDRLAAETGIDRITCFDDVVPLGLPHTMYKSYAATDVENGRWDRLNKWLQTLSAYDLSKVDLAGVDSIETWLERVEAATPMRPVSSSGTTGKISILPRGLPEDDGTNQMIPRVCDPYRDEYGFDMRDGTVPFLCPWPSDSGRQAFIRLTWLLRNSAYKGHEDNVHTVGKGWITADELKLASRLRKAEDAGEELILNEAEQRIAAAVAERNRALPGRVDAFVENVVEKLAGRKVILFGFWTQLYQLAVACKKKGVKVRWSDESLIATGGGTKGFTFPEGWRDVLDEVFPFRLKELYGMSETTALAIGCSQGYLHPLPWGIKHVLDPATSQPKPRKGIQTGRLLVHDLISTSLWPTTLTGDLVTVNFDGGCACGRTGIFIHKDINRLSEALGGDDKITCAKTPQAYERLEEFALSAGL